jgi:hypothetical protein
MMLLLRRLSHMTFFLLSLFGEPTVTVKTVDFN